MLCSYKTTVFPRDGQTSDNGYMVAVYKLHEKVAGPDESILDEVKVVGYMLPTAKSVLFDIKGSWEKNKRGYQYNMTSYEEHVQPTKEGVIAYLSSGLIKGIGPKIAERIFDVFGINALKILDSDPGQLLSISGISERKLECIKTSYLAYRGARDLVAFLAPFGVTPSRAVTIYEAYGANAIGIAKEHPYRLCEMHGIGFATADRLAMKMGLDARSMERIEAGVIHSLKKSESVSGHLFLEGKELQESSRKLLDTINVRITGNEIKTGVKNLLARNYLVNYRDGIYRWPNERAEQQIANKVYELLAFGQISYPADLDQEIAKEETTLGIKLEPEQKTAIKTCLTSHICVVTGGPGTGKTLIQRITLRIFRRCFNDARIVCCAPTGRAASRLSDSTGEPASTIHRLLNIMPDDVKIEPELLEADMVLGDEISMLDIYLARQLFCAIPHGCQLILVGDIDQLESVGPGAVLKELIDCGVIPVVRLERVFRQGRNNIIPVNAKLIRNGVTALEYDKNQFDVIRSETFEQSAKLLKELYQTEVARVGISNLVLLSPFRQKSVTGVATLNSELRDLVNPPVYGKCEIVRANTLFREGDRVMQVKNNYHIPWEDQRNHSVGEGLYNGDLGFIKEIKRQGADQFVYVLFDDGRLAEYDQSEMDQLDLAYANTIHKSQGSEYKVVLLNLQKGHYMMLRRSLIYTAITRAREKVVIVGAPAALYMAIKNDKPLYRNTHLADRIVELDPSHYKISV